MTWKKRLRTMVPSRNSRATFGLSGSIQNDIPEDSTPYAEPEAHAELFQIRRCGSWFVVLGWWYLVYERGLASGMS